MFSVNRTSFGPDSRVVHDHNGMMNKWNRPREPKQALLGIFIQVDLFRDSVEVDLEMSHDAARILMSHDAARILR